ncbi:MAG: hypothetical protein KKC18_02730, partial [Chloroflexi bacterium]|nr:hypothetical protein [Chloroflexota bacterium]
WAPDSGRIAFRSCLVQQADGGWQPTPAGPPQIYLLEQANQRILITPVAEGSAPAWRPISAGPTHLSGAANRPFTPKGQQAPLLAVGMNGPYA